MHDVPQAKKVLSYLCVGIELFHYRCDASQPTKFRQGAGSGSHFFSFRRNKRIVQRISAYQRNQRGIGGGSILAWSFIAVGGAYGDE